LFVGEPDRDEDDEEDDDVDEEDEDDDEFCSLMFGDFELFVLVVVKSELLDESSCLTSSRAAKPMLSLVMTRLSMSSEPSAVAMAI